MRFDVTTGDWVVVAAERGARPDGLAVTPPERSPTEDFDPECPFCVTGDAVVLDEELEPNDASRWSVRMIANKYPALRPELSSTRRQLGSMFHEMDGHGSHEVLIESPHHAVALTDQPLEHVERMLRVLHRRCRALALEPELEVVQIFKNSGAAAGSSQPHPHFQLIAMPIVPRQVRIKFEMAAEHFQLNGRSVYADVCAAELEARERLVATNADFVAFAPYASRAPYETWIVPRAPAPTFGLASGATLGPLADLLVDTLRRLRGVLGEAPFNLVINSAPRRHADEPDFVWHVEILPRLSQPAGFEIATGMAINPVPPELAASRLRAAGGASAR
ncbi:MAG TPA: DUF4931 domain-containing protein [Polyangiaceae bacterium]|nr:DUF4931 domain-containing protein [Polyangiaceae bacterium]